MALARALESTNHHMNADDLSFILWIADSITRFPGVLEGLETGSENQSYRSVLIGLMMSAMKIPLLPPVTNLRKECLLLRAIASITELLDADVSDDNGTITIRQYLNALDTILSFDIKIWDNGRLEQLSDLAAVIHRTLIDYYGFPDGIDKRQSDDGGTEIAPSIRLVAREIQPLSEGTLDGDSVGSNGDNNSRISSHDDVISGRHFGFILLALDKDVCNLLLHFGNSHELSSVDLRILRLREALETIIGHDVDHYILGCIDNQLKILMLPFDNRKESSTVKINGLDWNTMSARVNHITSSQQEALRSSLPHSLKILRKVDLQLLSNEAGVSMISAYIYFRVLGKVCRREENWREPYRNPFEEIARQCIPQLRPEELFQYLNAQTYATTTEGELSEILEHLAKCRSAMPELMFDAILREVIRLNRLYRRMDRPMPENIPTYNQRPPSESSDNSFSFEGSPSSSVGSEPPSVELFTGNFYTGITMPPSLMGVSTPRVTRVSGPLIEARLEQETFSSEQESHLYENDGPTVDPVALGNLSMWQDQINSQPARYSDETLTHRVETFHWLWRDFDNQLSAVEKRDILADVLLAVTQDRYNDMPLVNFKYGFMNMRNDKVGTSVLVFIVLTTVDEPLPDNTAEAFAAYRDRLRMMARIGKPDSEKLQMAQRATLPGSQVSRCYESWS
ncbi:hypothetical protein BZA77DRAFT_293566 [Pyronema omphalodes]|nr:hypothetical protein BZA77DRAFT_293566 [Pyronema omphalodes]